MQGARRRGRFGVEAACAVLGTVLFVLTLISRDWIEVVFGVDPDRGSGAIEVVVSLGRLAVAIVGSALARREWRRVT